MNEKVLYYVESLEGFEDTKAKAEIENDLAYYSNKFYFAEKPTKQHCLWLYFPMKHDPTIKILWSSQSSIVEITELDKNSMKIRTRKGTFTICKYKQN